MLGAALDQWGRQQHPQHPPEAIVLLGCPPRLDGTPSPALLRRCKATYALAQRFPEARVVVTGGGTPSEASCAAKTLCGLGLVENRIGLEDISTSTEENARYARQILGDVSVLVVSDSYHLLRSRLVFRRYFTRVEVSGAATPRLWRAWLREGVVLGMYGVRGFLG